MINRFIAGLTSPTRIISYKNDKWYYPLLVILIMILISLIPITYYSLNTEIFTYDVQKGIRTAFLSGDLVEYNIIDNVLVYEHNAEDKTKVDSPYGRFIFTNSEVELNDLSRSLNYIFLKDKFVINYSGVSILSYNYSELPNFNNLDFREAKVDNKEFWNKVFTDVDMVFDSMQEFFLTGNIIGNVLYIMTDVLVCSLLIAFLIKFQTREKFSCSFKLALYASIPSFVGVVLSLLYKSSFINTIGLIWSFVFAYRISYMMKFKGGL